MELFRISSDVHNIALDGIPLIVLSDSTAFSPRAFMWGIAFLSEVTYVLFGIVVSN